MSANLKKDLKKKFADPPSEYGPIDCWWWEGAALNREQMTWQLEQLKEKGVAGTFFYARLVNGEPWGSDPAYWSEEWWEYFKWSIQEHKRLGLIAWTDDWTAHEFAQNWLREQRAARPELTGKWLKIHETAADATGEVYIEIPENQQVICAAAYKYQNGVIDYDSRLELSAAVRDGILKWEAPEAGWLALAVTSESSEFDFLNRDVADLWIEYVLGKYEQKLGGHLGDTLKVFGTDEWPVLRGNIAFSDSLVETFKDKKGYDPVPLLPGLFHDTGSQTDKIRCDYYEVMASMLEENLYQPFADWLHKRGMQFADFCPQGKDMDLQSQTREYGDFYRFSRNYDLPGTEWNQGPNRFHAKLASSITHVYGKERTGLCGYWALGWGHNQESNLKLTNENYAYGINLYNRHGVLYSTNGGWYEWVPPAVHFRQPYWENWKVFTDYIRRLSFLLSRGKHVADIAVLYPITSIHANWSNGNEFSTDADETNDAAHRIALSIYESGIDLDFIDYQSLCEAEISGGKLKVSGIEFPSLLLLPMTTMRIETLQKIQQFYDGGGTVFAFRRLPSASAEGGRGDPVIRTLLTEIFGIPSDAEYHHPSSFRNRICRNENAAGGKAFFVPSDAPKTYGLKAWYEDLPGFISTVIERDVECSTEGAYHLHKREGNTDIYFIYNTHSQRKQFEFTLRERGEPEIWDAFSGTAKPIHRFEPVDGGTKIRLSIGPFEGVVVVFSPGAGRPAVVHDNLAQIGDAVPVDGTVEVSGFADSGGKKEVRVLFEGRQYVAAARIEPPTSPLFVDGDWTFRLQPTMDNRWGDFRFPASSEYIGAEARSFKYRLEQGASGEESGWHSREFDDFDWPDFVHTFGPMWWATDPVRGNDKTADLMRSALDGAIDSSSWHWYSFSQKFGCGRKDVHRDWAGMLGVSEKFLIFDETGDGEDASRFLYTNIYSPEEQELNLDFGATALFPNEVALIPIGRIATSGTALFPREAWVNGQKVLAVESGAQTRVARREYSKTHFEEYPEIDPKPIVPVSIKKGWNRILLKIVQPAGEKVWTYVALYDPANPPTEQRFVPRLKWFRNPPNLIYDVYPDDTVKAGWFRFEAPPGLRTISLNVKARNVSAWVNGEPCVVRDAKVILPGPVKRVSQVALRVEHEPGYYAGAAFLEPVRFECETGLISLGDWCDYALESYSGAGVYTKHVELSAEQIRGKVLLDLGRVNSTAEVIINGKSAGTRLAKPYSYDITDFVVKGKNTIDVTIHNTLANHYSVDYPTWYVFEGQTASGLIGPVKLSFLSEVSLRCRQI